MGIKGEGESIRLCTTSRLSTEITNRDGDRASLADERDVDTRNGDGGAMDVGTEASIGPTSLSLDLLNTKFAPVSETTSKFDGGTTSIPIKQVNMERHNKRHDEGE